MSGLNPFRPKKPEASATAPTTAPTTAPAISTPAPTSTPATSTATPATPATPNIHPASSDTDENDRSSDDTDPFAQASYLSDDGYDGENERVQSSSNSASRLSIDGAKTQTGRRPLPAPPAARPASISSASSSILARQPSNASIDSRSLSSRPSTRDRKPPPPPKNHHGKLINPTSPGSSESTAARTGTPGTPYSPKHLGSDYFTPGPSQDESQPVGAPDTLRRSHSQYKRPPTPPLSRRHSQMTRSKSTLAKPTTRLSMPVGVPVATTDESSSPSSPGPEDPVSSKYPREDQSVVPASPIETSSPGKIPARRGSAQGPAATTPPPPPPRRAARPGSIISDRPSQDNQNQHQQQEQQEQQHQQDGFPHPSNANHILEDLSRLQKEVDDLRGRYENRKSVI